MTVPATSPLPFTLPDHTQLPESDGTFVKNFQEHPQSLLLTDSITSILQQHHPDGHYAIGQDCGIYWRLTDPPERGAIRVPFYGIYKVATASVEVYHLVDGRYRLLASNERGRYPIPSLEVELGLWQGRYQNAELPWLRWWDSQGNLLLTTEERAERLAAQLRAMGVPPEE